MRDNPVWFVTFCTHRRQKWLARANVHRAFIDFAQRALENSGISVGRYVIMPDHLHLFVTGGQDFILGRWVSMLKQVLAKAGGDWPGKTPRIWQEGFFDHLLRNDESMSQKWDYIRANPVRAGLATNADDWPYQGEIVVIDRA